MYQVPVLDGIEHRLTVHGTYDDVPGATCAALQLMEWLGSAEEWRGKARAWLSSSIEHQDLYNAATILEASARLQVPFVSDAVEQNIVQRILAKVDSWAPGVETLRYMRTLVAVGETQQAARHIAKLKPATTGGAEWLTIFGAAETVLILFDLYEKADEPGEELERLLIEGIEYLADEYDEANGTWRGNVVATAKAAKAMSRFSRLASSAVGETIRSLTGVRQNLVAASVVRGLGQRIAELTAISVQAEKRAHDTAASAEALQRNISRTQDAFLYAILAAYVAIVALVAIGLVAVFPLRDLVTTVRDWYFFAVPLLALLATLPAFAAGRFLSLFGRAPSWLSWARRNIPFGHRMFGAP